MSENPHIEAESTDVLESAHRLYHNVGGYWEVPMDWNA